MHKKNEKREMHKKRKIINSNTMTFVKEIYLVKKYTHIIFNAATRRKSYNNM